MIKTTSSPPQIRRRVAALLVLSTIFCRPHLHAQNASPASPQAALPTIHVTTRETVVDILVSDAQGHPVHGLTRDDFTISEDGKLQPIRSFLETRKDVPPAQSAIASNPRLPPNTYTNRRPPPATGSSNIILIDTLNAEPPDLMRSRQQAAKYLNTMPPGTQIAIFELSTTLRIVEGFSSDAASLIAAMDDNKNSLLQPAGVISPCYVPEITLKGLKQIAAFVSGIKGRKNLLWFVTHPPPEEDLCDPNLGAETFDMLAAAQIAIDPIDVRGLVNPLASDASTSLDLINRNTGRNAAAGTMYALQGQAGNLLGFEQLAERTGGQAFYNTNDLPASIGSAIENGANYYTLSYAPPSTAYDGRHHTIHVTVNRPKLTLVYRIGYGADDPKAIRANSLIPTKLASTTPDPAANTMNDSMARFAPTATQILFDIKLTPTTTPPLPNDPPIMGFPAADANLKSKPLTRYDILYTLPPDQLTFTVAPDGTHNGSIQFAIVVSDVFSKVVTSISRTIQLPLSPTEYAGFLQEPFHFLQQIDLPPGQIFLRAGILDTNSNKVGTLEIPVTILKK